MDHQLTHMNEATSVPLRNSSIKTSIWLELASYKPTKRINSIILSNISEVQHVRTGYRMSVKAFLHIRMRMALIGRNNLINNIWHICNLTYGWQSCHLVLIISESTPMIVIIVRSIIETFNHQKLWYMQQINN